MYAKSVAPAGALAVLLIAASSAQARSSELGAYGSAPAMQDATKIILVPGPGTNGSQVVSHAGDPQQGSSAGDSGPRSLGPKRSIQLGPLPASQGGGDIEPVHEPGSLGNATQAAGMREVLLSGRPGTPYAVVLTLMGSSNAPSILFGEGMLFGQDPSQGPRTIMIQVPAEFGVQLIALGQK